MLVAGGPFPIAQFAVILLAGVALYWAGMILNDVFDLEKDKAERAARPIPAGDIALEQAKFAGWGLLLVGVVLAFAAGHLPIDGIVSSNLPGFVAIALAIMIVLYDGPLKKTPLAPAAMGSCRILSFLMGAAPVVAMKSAPYFPNHVLGIAIGFGIYIMGVTTMARREATGGSSKQLTVGLIVAAVGVALIAVAPKFATTSSSWQFNSDLHYPILIGLVFLPVVRRGLAAIQDPVPKKIQNSIRTGILTLIPLCAVVALLGAGTLWGIVILALMAPTVFLASRLRVT